MRVELGIVMVVFAMAIMMMTASMSLTLMIRLLMRTGHHRESGGDVCDHCDDRLYLRIVTMSGIRMTG